MATHCYELRIQAYERKKNRVPTRVFLSQGYIKYIRIKKQKRKTQPTLKNKYLINTFFLNV